MTFANPAGAWALLALGAVLAIHLLQRRRRRVLVSTLFLLDPAPSLSVGGRRLERLRRSASLWLQLATVALLAFVLMFPQRLWEDSRQRVVVILDASISMSAFRAPLRESLQRRVSDIAAGAVRTDWVLLESAAGRRPLYSGPDAAALLAALDAWEPREPHHDVAPAFETARTLAGTDGLVVVATDHPLTVPEGFERLAVGAPLENVGVVGLAVDTSVQPAQFRAVVRNHGRHPARRELHIEAGGARSGTRLLELAPGAAEIVVGPFPPDQTALAIVLAPDAFTVDDRAFAVQPRRKRLRVRLSSPDPTAERWLKSLDAVDIGEPADVVLGAVAAAPNGDADLPAVRWLASGDARRMGDAVVSDGHPLVEGLSWRGLAVPASASFARLSTDTVLVWNGPQPLVVLRGERHLMLDFPLSGSNADRVPALLILVHRFLEEIRRAKVAVEHDNFECAQILRAPAETEAPLRVSWEGRGAGAAVELRAPWRPALFEVHAGDALRLVGATHFADVREADFTGAARSDERRASAHEVRRLHRRDDPLTPLWIAMIGTLLLVDWTWGERRST